MKGFGIYKIILILIVIFCVEAKSDDTYPLVLNKQNYYENSRLIVDTSANISSFLLKLNIGNQSLEIKRWNGIERKNEISTSIYLSAVLSHYTNNGVLYILYRENDKIFVISFDDSLNRIFQLKLTENSNYESTGKILGLSKQKLIVEFNQSVYQIQNQSFLEITSVNDFSEIYLINNNLIALNRNERTTLLKIFDISGQLKSVNRLELFEKVRIINQNNYIYILTSVSSHSHTLMHCLNLENGDILFSDWFNSKINHIAIKDDSYFRLEQKTGIYTLNSGKIASIDNKNEKKAELPRYLIEPYFLHYSNGKNCILFKNGIVSVNGSTIIGNDFFPFGEYFDLSPEMLIYKDDLFLSTDYNSLTFEIKHIEYWYINKFLREFSDILLPLVLALIAIIFLQLYRHQSRLLNELISLSSVGAIFIIDKNGRLIRTNPNGKEFLRISDNIPKRKFFNHYCNYEHTKPVDELIEKSLKTKESYNQRININIDGVHKEWLCSTIILTNIAGRFRGLVFTGIDITEQLERNRLSNWAQLAHDMQTNLSTIRLNAEQIDIISDNNKARQKKIFHQVNLLIERVRDIVTVGRTDKLDLQIASSIEIFMSVRNEFDELMFPNISFQTQLTDFPIECDKPKLIRALRNATENAIKAFKGALGTVTLICYEEDNYACFVVRDNGPGMDEIVKKKMLTPYFTTAKSEGGSGIGTMIMQHVIELHGGKIAINSELGKGTDVVFYVPNVFHKRKMPSFKKKFKNILK